MSDTALSETAMLASLQDIRLPAEAAGGIWADIALTMGLASLAALLVTGLVQLFSLRRPTVLRMSLRDRLVQIDALPASQRRVALLHLLKQVAPDRYEAIRNHLYRPNTEIGLETLRQAVADHA